MTEVNRTRARRAFGFLILLILVAGIVFPAFGQRRRTRPRLGKYTRPARTQTAPNYYTVPADTVIRVRMNDEISSGNARIGDRFSTTVVDPVYSRGVEVIPAGSRVWGRVSSVRKAGRRTPGNISVSFTQVELPNGTSRAINGSLTSLQKDVNADNEGTVTGKSNRKRDAVFIGGGAATGAIIGAIAGGGKGAAIGAILGGGLGTGARVYEKEQEAVVKRDTEFGVILNQSVSLPAANVR